MSSKFPQPRERQLMSHACRGHNIPEGRANDGRPDDKDGQCATHVWVNERKVAGKTCIIFPEVKQNSHLSII